VIDVDDPRPTQGAELPCPQAIEFLADVYVEVGGGEMQKAQRVSYMGPYVIVKCC
jgi:protein farnesyltransferase/geranylgeranyltransferase type-1 subunit alpha